jgi:hypothetical protein
VSARWGLEVRVRGGKFALDDVEVLEHVDIDTLDGDEQRVAELVQTEGVEVTESSFMAGPYRFYRFKTDDAEIAERYGFEVRS